MVLNSLVVQRQNLYDTVEMMTSDINNHQYTLLKRFHSDGNKKIVYRTYYNDKSSIFVSVTLGKENCPIEGLFDINTHKQSRERINGTYRIEYFVIGSLNGKQTCIATLTFISRGGIQKKIMDISLTDSDIPQSIEDLDVLLSIFVENICGLSDRTYVPELFKVSTIYSQIELLGGEKSHLKRDEIDIIDEVMTGLLDETKIESFKL